MKISDNLKVMTLPRIFKKKIFLFLLIFLFFLFVSPVKAMVVDGGGGTAGPGHYQFEVWEPAVYQTQEMNQQSFANETIRATIASFNDQLLGCVNCPKEQQEQGAVQNLGNLIAGMYSNPPASSVEYFADLGRNLGIAKPAYAQGIGFEGLRPILPIWKAFRNIAYLFFVIVFVFIGFAIMFRLKIDPQTVIVIQNALPKVIVALILVTFSYAIAGLLIDLIYVFISLLFAILGTQLTKAGSGITSLQQLLGENVFTASWRMLGETRFVTAPGSQIGEIVQSLLGDFPIISNIVGGGVGLIVTFIFAIAMAFAMFKLFFSLLISYISIIVGVIFSPLMLMLEALPGQKGLSSWLKMMLSNIIVFPLTAAIFMLGAILTHGFSQAGETVWVAPFLGKWGTANISPLIGFGIVLLAPSIIDMVKKAIGAPGIGAGIIAPISAAGGVIAAPAGAIFGPTIEAYRKYGGERIATAVPGLGRIIPPEIRKRYEKER